MSENEVLVSKRLKFRRYNSDKRGSFEVNVWFYDHEVSGIIGALKLAQGHHVKQGHKAYASFLKKLENKMSRVLGSLLKVELKDLKLKTEKELLESEC